MRWAKAILITVGVVSIVLVTSEAFAQCAMCKTAFTSSPEGQKAAQSLNHAILVLLCAPFLLLGTFALLIYKAHRSTPVSLEQEPLRRWDIRTDEMQE